MLLRNISIAKRLRYSFFLLALVPILVVGVFASYIAKKAIANKSCHYSLQIMDTLKYNIENELERYENLADEIILNGKVQGGVEHFEEMSAAGRKDFVEAINSMIGKKFPAFPYLRDVKIIDNNDQQLYQRGYLLNEETHVQEMLKIIKENARMSDCFGIRIYGKDYVVLSKVIYSVYNKGKKGYILLIIDENALFELYKNINLGEGSSLFLIDAQYKIISTNKQRGEGQEAFYADEKFKIDFKEEEGSSFNSGQGKEKKMVMHTRMQNYPIELFGTIPYRYLNKEAVVIQSNVIVMMVICFILSVLLSKGIAQSITKPLNELVSYIGEAVKQKFDNHFIDDSQDELGFVGRTFTNIIKQMKEMILQMEEEEKEKHELQLNMLQAQINPHFLFNTLNSLRWVSLMSGATNVSEGILALSDLLRNTIIHKGEYITIQEEIENINNYVLIQRLRYGDCFKVNYNLPESLLECKTLKFILQPIIENAIIHGGYDEQSVVNIEITLEEVNRALVCCVIDDGKGFDREGVALNNKVDKFSGIGLDNVGDRIRLNFGKEYGLEIESKIGRGTKVTLHIPKIEGEKNV